MMMCLSKSQEDDITMMCLSKSQDDDIMMMCLSKSQEYDITMTCLSKSLWRTKKSHFQASVEMGMKNVDKHAVNTTIGLLCYLVA